MRRFCVLLALVFSFSLTGCQICLTVPNPVKIVWDLFDKPSGTEVVFGTYQDLERLFYDPMRLKPSRLFNAALDGIAEELKSKNAEFNFSRIDDSASVVKAKKHFAAEYKKAEDLNAAINNSAQLEFAALKGLLDAVDSSHTAFITPERLNEIRKSRRGKSGYAGIGVVLKKLEDNFYYIDWVTPGSPAAEVGLRKFDRLVKVNALAIPNDIGEIFKLFRGEERISVKVTVERGGKTLDFTIAQREFDLHLITSRYINSGNSRFIYIELRGFDPDSATKLKNIIRRAEKENVKGIILDLRGNRGGLLDSLMVALEIFSKKESVMFIRRHYEEQELLVSGNPLTDLPMVMLADSRSASAAEIMAAVLQEAKRAIVVGTKTAGAVEVSIQISLPLGSAMTVAIQEVFTAEGTVLEKVGVKPDKEVQLSKDDISAAQDMQLEAALVELSKLVK
ncbi:MAG: hypothetical protein A3I24_04465 [Candidatus Harrisonbacteria bacterium RIFCSPLOWO2_02_FULL_41_13b]|uniref:PDZ domain-containing protein n=1 Tax=Candidatus Harrisonbacteria bacterium RIFCSPLOWO2_02_FULL_41_13b TaxID=1798409 RepID=A0A1G1ZQM5_9BACT|nr:MAG: hypothetical protein A3J53_02695 [Candidatus Harrisonbacteria bacterium RIFCSPHIGHO2_02_FULL_40_20]OGY66745.1 MAG: hypothetical protein A3I24_04465 [Candidatus Harrisonbacteria bacterium RIFCSPLOWO2_02_FULL_41_13b]